MGNGSERGEGGLRATVSLNPQSHRCSRQRAKKKIDGGGDPPFPVIPPLLFYFFIYKIGNKNQIGTSVTQ